MIQDGQRNESRWMAFHQPNEILAMMTVNMSFCDHLIVDVISFAVNKNTLSLSNTGRIDSS